MTLEKWVHDQPLFWVMTSHFVRVRRRLQVLFFAPQRGNITGLLIRYLLQPFETCFFFNTKIKVETSVYKLQCSGGLKKIPRAISLCKGPSLNLFRRPKAL